MHEAVKKAFKEGALIESKSVSGIDEWKLLTREPSWLPEYLYRIKDGISIAQWSVHNTTIKAYWDGAIIEFSTIMGTKFQPTVGPPTWEIGYVYRAEKSEAVAFMKHDDDKNRLELIDPVFIEGLGKVLTFGAEKYDAWNWQKASSHEDRERIYGALQRHLSAYRKGEKFDSETGLSHLYHAQCNMMFLDYFDRKDESVK